MVMGNIFYKHNVVGGVVQINERHIWREDTQWYDTHKVDSLIN